MAYEFFNKWAPVFIDLLMKDFDLTLEDAVAIVGNAGHESGGFQSLQEKKPLVPGSRGGYGIMQWTGPRRKDYEAYCQRNKYNPADMEVNYKFLFVELKGPEGKNALPALRAAKGLTAKVQSFMKKFLRPGIEHLDSRQVWAARALAAWNANPVIPEVEVEKENEMNLSGILGIVVSLAAKNSKAIGAAIGGAVAQIIDPTVLGPITADPAFQSLIVTVLSAAVGAWFAPKNK